jgi:membrane dipeptidase
VILDGHNDLALRLWLGLAPRHVRLEEAADADFAGGFFALSTLADMPDLPSEAPYAIPLPGPATAAKARADVEAQLAQLEKLDVTIVRTVAEICPDRVSAIVHLEGAEPIEPDLSDLESWYDRGVRSIGLVWSRPNAFGEGVPFRFPSSPDCGPGLTAAGEDLVRACNRLGILVDVSHLTEAGFWDVARVTQAPIVATHSSVHELCPASRNLTDRQLDAIGESGGVVGINFAVPFVRSDGRNDPATTTVNDIVGHVNYVVSRLGVEHVAFGSDFDGADVPADVDGIASLPRLVEALRAVGHDDDSLALITHRNWLRVLGETWASTA